MKTEIERDGKIWIIAETFAEAFALKYLTDELPDGLPLVFNTGILLRKDMYNPAKDTNNSDEDIVQRSDARVG